MNRLAAILPPSNVLVNVDATSKRVFEHAGLLFENEHAVARATVTDNLFARERLGSTGLGHGVAIPYGGSRGLKNPSPPDSRAAADRVRRAGRQSRSACSSSCSCPGGDAAPPGDPVRIAEMLSTANCASA